MSQSQNTFVETDCTVKFNEQSFTSGGAFIGRRKDNGKLGGILYAYEQQNMVGDWHGQTKVLARFGNEWHSNFGDTRQSVYFTWQGIPFYGIYYKSGGDIVRVREITSA